MNEITVEKRTGMAITSLVLSITGIFSYGIASIFGVIFGHIAKRKIKRKPQLYGGDSMATAGLILGYLVIIVYMLAVVAVGSLFANLWSWLNVS